MSSYYSPPQPQFAPPKKTNPWPWIAGGCLLLFVGFVGFMGLIMTITVGSMRASTPYKDGMERARRDDRVAALLGRPIESGWFITGSIKTYNGDGSTHMRSPLRGPKGKATLYVTGMKEAGRWSYSTMTVTPPAGDPIDLLRGEWLDRAPPGA